MGKTGVSVPSDVDDIRQTIQRCRRLASAITDDKAAAGLRRMADDLQQFLDVKASAPVANAGPTRSDNARGPASR